MYKTNSTAPAVVLSIVISFIAASPSFGSQITYTEQVTAQGTFNGSVFTDANVLLTMIIIRPVSLLLTPIFSLILERQQ